MRRLLRHGAAVVVLAVAALAPAAGARTAPPADDEPSCVTAAPPLSVSGVTDDGARLQLRALILLDGVPRARAEAVLAQAAEAYAPLDIALTAKYREVTVTLDPAVRDPLAFIRAAEDAVGGRRPKGFDVVHLLTSRDMAGFGYAKCIGGVAFDKGAFSVSEDWGDRGPMITGQPVGPVQPIPMPWLWGEGTARTLAHELGHLMGGQHHLSNCAEGLAGDSSDLPRPCTLMDGSLTMQMRFSTANAAVVRGYAVGFLQPAR